MADKDNLKELKRLSPKERIEKLKELQKKDKEEIEKAQKLLQEAEDEEESKQKELERIPIPQLRAVDIDALFSPEEKELFSTKRFVTETRKEEKPEEARRRPEEKAELERIAEEARVLKQEEEATQAQYLTQLSQKPVEDIYNKVKSIYQEVKSTGEITPEQMNELNNVGYANRRKMQDIQTGKYTEVTQETAREMVLTEKMRSWLQESYGR